MSANSGGSFATVLLALPLSAIALMGVFGVPQFSSVIASPHEEEMIRRPGELQTSMDDAPRFGEFDERRATPQSEREPRPFPGSERELASSLGSSTSFGNGPQDNDRSNLGRSAHWQEEHSTPRDNTAPNPWANAPMAQNDSNPTPSLDWRAASRRLSEMGVDRYHLERGATPESFLFVCLVSPADNPQVTHRFEAEHSDPLHAVGDVLGQVDGWLQQRYAQNTFPRNSITSAR